MPPGVYFRMLMVGQFEKLPSERRIAWRYADSLRLRAFLGLAPKASSPDDSSLNRTRLRIDLEAHQAIFDWVLKRLAEHELLQGRAAGRMPAGPRRGVCARGGTFWSRVCGVWRPSWRRNAGQCSALMIAA